MILNEWCTLGRKSKYKDFSYYGGTPRTPHSVLKNCPIIEEKYGGAYASFASGAVVILIAILTHYKNPIEHTNQILFQIMVVVGIMAPVWFISDYGFDYHEGILYFVEDGKLETYHPTDSDYVSFVLLTISGCIIIFPILAHTLALVSSILVIVLKKRDYPFYVEWGFVIPFFVVVVFSLVLELQKKRNKPYKLLKSDYFIN